MAARQLTALMVYVRGWGLAQGGGCENGREEKMVRISPEATLGFS